MIRIGANPIGWSNDDMLEIGIRIATHWVDGPALAERPGRLAAWRAALDKLTRPIATLSA